MRASALPMRGTPDVWIWKIWTANAARMGVLPLYGVGGQPPQRRELEYNGESTTVDYPPLSLVALGAAGHLWQRADPAFRDTPGLVAAIKLPVVLAEAFITALIYLAARRMTGGSVARLAALAFWLNPAALLDGAVLGYLDPLYALPSLAALLAAAGGLTFLAGALAAASVLTKVQAIVLLPAVWWLVASHEEGWHRRLLSVLEAGAGSLGAACLVLVPFVTAGAWPNLRQAVGRLATHDMLSANAANAWWLVTWLTRALDAMPDVGAWRAVTAPTRILTISRAVELGFPNPRAVGILLVAACTAWALWKVRRGVDLSLGAGLGAFTAHAFFLFSAQVHENHLFLAVPLAVLAGVSRPGWRPVALGLSLATALNLNLFYGFGWGIGYALPRNLAVLDGSVLLATANLALFVQHAKVLAREADQSMLSCTGQAWS